MMRERITCDLCGEEITCEPNFVEGRQLCQNCYDYETFRCDCCGGRYLLSHEVSDEHISICEECYEDHCLLHFKELGLYVYASTPNIMKEALTGSFLKEYDFEEIEVEEGDIISINREGIPARSCFTPHDDDGFGRFRNSFGYQTSAFSLYEMDNPFGIPYEDLDLLYEMGYCDDDIELLTNDKELLRYCIDEARVMLGEYV